MQIEIFIGKNILLKGACKLHKSYTYEFRLKKEHEIKHF